MGFQRQSGRKRIVAPDGNEIVPVNQARAEPTWSRQLARAWRWQRLLDDGIHASVGEIGDAEGISKSYISWTLGWRCWRPTSWRRSSRGGPVGW